MSNNKNPKTKTPWNPSKKATARVKNWLPLITFCSFCNGEVSVANNSTVYGKEFGEWPWIFRCNDCCAYVGMHPFTNIPLGTLANKQTRDARKHGKTIFISLYKSNKLERKTAYKLLAEKLSISIDECHWGLFDAEMCKKAEQASIDVFLNKGDI